MTDEHKRQPCQYICPRKLRQCKMFTSTPLSTHCMEHLLHDLDLDEPGQERLHLSGMETKQSLRVPCPINPTHSVSPHDLKRHLRRCNQRPIILGPFHRPGCNSGAECDNHEDYSTIFQDTTDQELQELVIRLEKIYDDIVQAPIGTNSTPLECHLVNVDLTELGHRNRKHLEQIGSLIAQLAHLNLLQGHTCFVEMGAGRGQLSHELHACLKQESTVHFTLIERDHQRYRFDAHHRLESQGPSFKRHRLDIRDLYLAELPSVKDAEPPADVVVISKHLCGSATDLALRCATDAHHAMGRVRAILIALCCYHRLMWNDYVGKDFFRRMNLTPKDFMIIRAMTTWCTNENRHRLPQDAKRSTIDGPSFEISAATSTDKSSHSKLRLFSIEDQERIGHKAKRLLDWGRIEYLVQHGFDAHLQVYAPKSITLENIALIATPRST